ncbi:hypothetical protein, partial [Pseudomonas aeruginosa]|uniref:hypothetical protein n=1 Tax=Pseudomonas aeruginosa TaxID=287 RepID=UPI0031B6A8E0
MVDQVLIRMNKFYPKMWAMCRWIKRCIKQDYNMDIINIFLNAANALFIYQPFMHDQRARG